MKEGYYKVVVRGNIDDRDSEPYDHSFRASFEEAKEDALGIIEAHKYINRTDGCTSKIRVFFVPFGSTEFKSSKKEVEYTVDSLGEVSVF